MISPARRAAYDVLCRVELGGAFSDEVLNSKVIANIAERDRNLATEVCYGTLRWQLSLDDVLGQFSSRAWKKIEPRAQILLRMSLYQLWHTDRIPDHALVNDAVEIAKTELDRGKAGFINGLLRTLGRERPWKKAEFDEKRPEWVRASLPEWLWQRWSVRFGSAAAFRYALSLNRPPQAALWNLDCGKQDCPETEVGTQSEVVPGARLVEKTLHDSRYWIQDEASQLIPHLFGSIAGRRIWDACAAPGGKSAILSSLCGEHGLVVASDLHWKRAKQMNSALHALKYKRPAVLVANAEASHPFRKGTFDAVLADVPCSGLGTLRRNPEIKWRFQPGRFSALQRRQLAILDAVSGAVQTGGALLYSTCSTEPEENEQVVHAFLASHPDFRLGRPHALPGIEPLLDPEGMLRTFPSERGWDGFFGALMFRFS